MARAWSSEAWRASTARRHSTWPARTKLPSVVGAAATRLLPFRLQVAADAEEGDDDHADRKHHDDKRPKSGSHKIDIVVQAIDDPAIVRREHASFLFPR